MSNEQNHEVFSFAYSAKQQEEVKRIRQKYIREEESKLERLRALDAQVTRKGTALSLVLGVLSSLVLGVGMCCCLVWSDAMFIPGIFIGLLGIAGVAMAYPAYMRITQKERERLAPEILRLADELMNP